MSDKPKPATFTISVFTRHSADCPQTNPQWKRCNCRKSLYIYEHGKVRYRSAKTRSWEQAERVAQAERDERDPVKIRLREIAEQETAKTVPASAGAITVEDALDRWLKAHKDISAGSTLAYKSTSRKILRWAAAHKIVYLRDVSANALDRWRGEWSPDAHNEDDRMGATTQSHLLTRLKGFFDWATKIRLIDRDPAHALASIKRSDKRTLPLDREQFKQLLAATALYDTSQPKEVDRLGVELRTLFLVMRWSGLRIRDALMLPHSALRGNRLSLTTQKTKTQLSVILPDEVVAALNSLRRRENVHPDSFFWSRKCTGEALVSAWVVRIKPLNEYLNFTDEEGNPMKFHSHMLRDTFAVEMLLAGATLEDVSRLLTHKSIRVTERYYSPWVKSRQKQLEENAVAAMRRMGVTVSV